VKRPIDQRSRDLAYRAWGWHLSHANALERTQPGAGAGYLRHMAQVLADAKAGELSRLSAFPQERKAS
jgi:hypothetical protein